MVDRFVNALNNNSIDELQQVPKSDLHSHAGRGGSSSYIASWAGVQIAPPPRVFESLGHMQTWFEDTIKPYCKGEKGNLKRWEAAFAQAEKDTISVLALSFSTNEIGVVNLFDPYELNCIRETGLKALE